MGGAGSTCGEERAGMHTVLVRKREGKRPLRRPRLRWENNIKMDIQEVGCVGVVWIDVAQDRDRLRSPLNAVINLRGSIKCREFLD
jgi:hypothetical protein